MLAYSPAQRNKTGLDPVNPALTVGEVQHQLAVYQFVGIPRAEQAGQDEALSWQRNRVELLKLRLLELDADPLPAAPPALLATLSRAKRVEPAPAPAVAPETPALDQWAELLKAVLAV